jgi:hypothetical protein
VGIGVGAVVIGIGSGVGVGVDMISITISFVVDIHPEVNTMRRNRKTTDAIRTKTIKAFHI